VTVSDCDRSFVHFVTLFVRSFVWQFERSFIRPFRSSFVRSFVRSLLRKIKRRFFIHCSAVPPFPRSSVPPLFCVVVVIK